MSPPIVEPIKIPIQMDGRMQQRNTGRCRPRTRESRPLGLGNRRKSADRPRLTFREQLVGGFVQMPLGALSICQVSNQLSGKLVNVHASEVIDLLSLEIEDGRPKDDRYVDATAVEYFSVHDLPPIEGLRGKGCACWAAIARQIALGLFPLRL